MHLDIEQTGTTEERVSSANGNIVKKLYDLAYEDESTGVQSKLDETTKLVGTVRVDAAYEDQVNYLNEKFKDGFKIVADTYYMSFVDPEVERVILEKSGYTEGITSAQFSGITEMGKYQTGSWWYGNTIIEKFPEFGKSGLKEITTSGFERCTNLTEVDLSQIKRINASGFRNCAKLKSINNVDNLSVIGNNGLSNTNVETLNLPVITEINQLGNMPSLKEVTLPSNGTLVSVEANQAQLFTSCPILTRINNVSSISRLGAGLGKDSPNLTHLMNFANVASINNRGAFQNGYYKEVYLPKITVPCTDRKIGYDPDKQHCTASFGGVNYVIRQFDLLYLRDITTVDRGDFFYSGIQNLIINNTTVPSVTTNEKSSGYEMFDGGYVINIYVPDTAVDAYKADEEWGKFADKIKPLSEMPTVDTEAEYDVLKASGDTTIRLIKEYM